MDDVEEADSIGATSRQSSSSPRSHTAGAARAAASLDIDGHARDSPNSENDHKYLDQSSWRGTATGVSSAADSPKQSAASNGYPPSPRRAAATASSRPLHDSTTRAINADVYTSMARQSSRSTIKQGVIGSAASAAAAASAEADPLASPQPARPAPRPHAQVQQQHPQSRPHSSQLSMDAEFEQSQQWRHSLASSERPMRPPPATAPAPSARPPALSHSQGAPYRSAPSALTPPAALSSSHSGSAAPASSQTPDSHESRRRQWLEQKRFVLTRLRAALRSKAAEVSSRARAVSEDQPACAARLQATLDAFVSRTQGTLCEMGGQIQRVLADVERCAARVDGEVKRFEREEGQDHAQGQRNGNDDGDSGRASSDDPPQQQHQFALVAQELEEQLKHILGAVASRDNFSLAQVTASFDPFQVARVQALEGENEALRRRVEELELGATQLVALPGPPSVVVPLPETQGILAQLQSQVEQLSASLTRTRSDLERVRTEHASVQATLAHERTQWNSRGAELLKQVAQLEESLRAEQGRTHSTQAQLDQIMHELSATCSRLATLQASAAREAREFQEREAERNDELARVRTGHSRALEAQAHEIRELQARIVSQQSDHAEQLRCLRTQGTTSAHQHLAQALERFEGERSSWAQKVHRVQGEADTLRSQVESEGRKHSKELALHTEQAAQQVAQLKGEHAHALAALQRKLDAQEIEASKLQKQLLEQRKSGEAQSLTAATQVAQAERAREAAEARASSLELQVSTTQASLKQCEQHVALVEARESNAQLDASQWRNQLAHEQEQVGVVRHELSAAKGKVEELQRLLDECRLDASDSSKHHGSLQTKLRSTEHALELAQQRLADQVRAGESKLAEALLREQKLARQGREQEMRAQEAQRGWDAARSTLEAQLAAASSALADQKAAAAQSLESFELERQQFAQMQRAAQQSAHEEQERSKAALGSQVELALARFVAAQGAKVEQLARRVEEQAKLASSMGLWASSAPGAGGDGVAEEVAALSALRAAVQPSSSSSMPSPSSLASSAATSTSAFEALLQQVESQVSSLVSRAAESRRAASDRYAQLVAQLQRQGREQLRQAQQDAATQLKAAQDAHAVAMQHAQETLRSEVDRLHAERRDVLALATDRAAQEALEASAALAAAKEDAEARLEQQRQELEEHYRGLIEADRAEFERRERGWIALREQMEEQAEAQRATQAELATKLATSEADLHACRVELDEREASHRVALREQAEKASRSLAESLGLFERKVTLERDLLLETHRAALENLQRDSAERIELVERSAKDMRDELELRYVAQLEGLAQEHEQARSSWVDTVEARVTTLEATHREHMDELHLKLEAEHRVQMESVRVEQQRRLDERERALQQQLDAQAQQHADELAGLKRRCIDALKELVEEHRAAHQEEEERHSNNVQIDVGLDTSSSSECTQQPRQPDESLVHHLDRSRRVEDDDDAHEHGVHGASSSSVVTSSSPSQRQSPHRRPRAGSDDSASSASPFAKERIKSSSAATAAAAAAAAQLEQELSSLQLSALLASRQANESLAALSLELVERTRERDRLQQDLTEALADQTKSAEQSQRLAAAENKLGEALQQVELHRTHAQALSDRWASLAESHGALQRQLDDSLASARAEQSKWQERMEQLRGEVEEGRRARDELVQEHALERRRWESLLQARKEEFDMQLQGAKDEAASTLQRREDELRRELNTGTEERVRAVQAKFEDQIRESNSAVQRSESIVRSLEARIAKLDDVVASHESRVTELATSHSDDLAHRESQWRSQRRAELDRYTGFIRAKMDAIMANQQRREEALCHTCRTKLGATTFRAALHRLCDEAVQVETYSNMHAPRQQHSPTAGGAGAMGSVDTDEPRNAIEPQPPAHSAGRPLSHISTAYRSPSPPPTAATAAPATALSTNDPSPPTPFARATPASLTSSHPPRRDPSPGSIAAKYVARVAQHRQATPRATSSMQQPPVGDDVAATAVDTYSAAVEATSVQQRQQGVLTLRYRSPSISKSADVSAAAPITTSASPEAAPMHMSSLAQARAAARDRQGRSPSPSAAAQPTAASSSSSLLDQYLAQQMR